MPVTRLRQEAQRGERDLSVARESLLVALLSPGHTPPMTNSPADPAAGFPLLATKLYIPTWHPGLLSRPRLIEQLNQGIERKLTLISASAGFGKTTVVSEWVARCERPVAWLSLHEADSDPPRFLAYLIAALQTVAEAVGHGLLTALRSPQPPSLESMLTVLLNELAAVPDKFVLVLDDFHVIDAPAIDQALTFLIEHMPPRMHLVIATRVDPRLPLARLRSRGQLTELRAAELRFTATEAAAFLNQTMGLNLSADHVAALDQRTEGWIAGLQLAAISMRGHDDAAGFVSSFTGSHRFVLDYLVEEVLHQQSERVQEFLLRTSILDRMCGSLCDAVLGDPAASGQETLDELERANLFIVPLDNERRWRRYHHLFAELLRQRLHQRALRGQPGYEATELRVRASIWFEEQGLELEALHYAAAAGDVGRAERLIEGKGTPLYARGGLGPVLQWLESLPAPVLDDRPALLVMFATALAVAGSMTRVEPKLRAAETALQRVAPDQATPNLLGRIASIRSLVALMAADPREIDAIIARSRSTPEQLTPDNPRYRFSRSTAVEHWKLGLAYQYQGDRAAARLAHADAIAASEASGNTHVTILATTCLGRLQEHENQLALAAGTYRRVLRLVGDPPGPVACEAHVGLARIHYEWNDLDAAHQHGQLSAQLARQLEIASFVSSELFLTRLLLAQGDVEGASALLAGTDQSVRERGFFPRMPEVVAARVQVLLRQGNLAEAAQLAQTHDVPLSRARVLLAQGDASAALAALELWRRQVEAKDWVDERLNVMVLQAVAHHAGGQLDSAVNVLGEALALAEPGGCIRLFLDEGTPMGCLLTEAMARGISPAYAGKLLAAFAPEEQRKGLASLPAAQPLAEPLSQRELEVLHLIAQGLSNREIGERLFLALDTVKGHNRKIFGKLEAQSRTEALARARALNLLP